MLLDAGVRINPKDIRDLTPGNILSCALFAHDFITVDKIVAIISSRYPDMITHLGAYIMKPEQRAPQIQHFQQTYASKYLLDAEKSKVAKLEHRRTQLEYENKALEQLTLTLLSELSPPAEAKSAGAPETKAEPVPSPAAANSAPEAKSAPLPETKAAQVQATNAAAASPDLESKSTPIPEVKAEPAKKKAPVESRTFTPKEFFAFLTRFLRDQQTESELLDFSISPSHPSC